MNLTELIKVNFKLLTLYLDGGKVETSDFKNSYDSLADSYNKEWYAYLDDVTSNILNNLPDIKPEYILDAGCGTGSSTYKLKQKFLNAHITGLDFSEPMLELARKRLGDDKVLLFRETIEKGLNKFKNSQFDLITFCWSLGYVANKRIYKEIPRILSENGSLLIITNKQDTLKAVQSAMKHTMFTHYKAIQKVPIHKFPKDKDYLLSRLGAKFTEINYGEDTFSIDFTTKPSVVDWLLNTGILAGYEYILDLRNNESQRKTFENYIRSNFNEVTHNYMWLLVKKV